jgi:pyrophosphatase PpaX
VKKAVVFDFDGTVADTLPVCFYAFQQVFRKFDGRELTKEEILAMFGPSEADIIGQNLTNQSEITNAISYYYQSYQEKHNEYVRPFTSLHDLLLDMKKAGYQIAIFTGKGRRSLDISLNQLKLNLFDILIAGDDVTQPKPDPQGLFIIMEELDSQPRDIIMIGDSDADIEAGMRANVQTVRVEWLPSALPRSFRRKPDYVFTEVKELRSLLGVL